MSEIPLDLLLITGGRHPFGETTPVIAACLSAAGHAVTVTRAAAELAAPDLGRFAALVFNSCRGGANDGRYAIPAEELDNDFDAAQRAGLQAYVAGGGGLVSLHVAPTSCPGWPELRRITGGGWVWGQSRHPPFDRFRVTLTDRAHPVAAGIEDFETDDELYCDLEVPADAHVFLAARHEGNARPLGWTVGYGAGRVVNLSLGHAAASVENPGFQALLVNAVRYVVRRR